jgi:S-adenosylmethionine hydrolase
VVEGEVIHVDAFGNLITSLPAEALASNPGGELVIQVEGGEGTFEPTFGRTFSDVESGALIAYIGSGGQLEIARRDGSAARRMGAARGTSVRVRSAPP